MLDWYGIKAQYEEMLPDVPSEMCGSGCRFLSVPEWQMIERIVEAQVAKAVEVALREQWETISEYHDISDVGVA